MKTTKKILLHDFIEEKLKKEGDLSVHDFISLCLYHEEWGYYTSRDRIFGRSGDFTTAPYITSLFSEAIALSVLEAWERASIEKGKPLEVEIYECGPGEGRMMLDMMTLWKKFPRIYERISRIGFVEIHPGLRHKQKDHLEFLGKPLRWYDRVEEIQPQHSDIFISVLGNEFLDVLPIVQEIEDSSGNWHPRKVYLNGERIFLQKEGRVRESCPQAESIIQHVERLLTPGIAIFVDYGDDVPYECRYGDTLQGVYRHQRVDVGDHMGEADLSHHVDFYSLRKILRNGGYVTTQKKFLERYGIGVRYQQVSEKNESDDLTWAMHRLLSPSEMGCLFKVLVFENDSQHPTFFK